MATKAQKEAIKRYETYKVDRINIRLPKGIKDRILSTGQSVNAFIIDAVNAKLDAEVRGDNCQPEPNAISVPQDPDSEGCTGE